MSNKFLEKVRANRAQQADSYLRLIEEYSPDDRESFSSVIEGFTQMGLSQQILSDEFKVSPATISRWCRGKSIPPEYVRGILVSRASDLLNKMIEELECTQAMAQESERQDRVRASRQTRVLVSE